MTRSTANKYLSWYVLLRDAVKLEAKRPGINSALYQWCECCTCGRIISRFEQKSHAGHFFPKGLGGSSGVYWDERNVHAQCHTCNYDLEGNRTEYYPFMLKTYGQEVVEELRCLHMLPRPHKITEYGMMYLDLYKRLLYEHNLESERIRRKVGKWKGTKEIRNETQS